MYITNEPLSNLFPHESVNPSFRGYVSSANPSELEDQLFFLVNNLTFSGVNRKQYLLTTVFLFKNLSSCILDTVLAGLFVLDRLLKEKFFAWLNVDSFITPSRSALSKEGASSDGCF